MSKTAAARSKVATNQKKYVKSKKCQRKRLAEKNNNNKNKCLKIPTKTEGTRVFVCGKVNLFLIFIIDSLRHFLPSHAVSTPMLSHLDFCYISRAKRNVVFFLNSVLRTNGTKSIVINEFVHKMCQIEAGCCRFSPHIFVRGKKYYNDGAHQNEGKRK